MRDLFTQAPSRREFLQLLGGGAAAVALGDYGIARAADLFEPAGAAAQYGLHVQQMRANLGDRTVSTIGFSGSLPGPTLRVREGQRLKVDVTNEIADNTSVHWHGIPIINKMDGVPGLTQQPIAKGTTFQYDFKVPVSGTYWYHSHSGAQMDRGMYGPLIADPKRETLSYDREVILVLDDWRDGMGRASRDLRSMFECQVGFEHQTRQIGQPPAEPKSYPLHLINGRAPKSPTEIQFTKGEVIRLRLINAGSATVYRVALAGHKMRVVRADGQPVVPVDVDALNIGMAERYDVLVHANNPGVWQLAADPSTPGPIARAVVRYNGSKGANPPANLLPKGMKGKILSYEIQRNDGGYGLPPGGKPDMEVRIELHSKFGAFYLTFNGEIWDDAKPYPIKLGSHVRFNIYNSSNQIHPMHLHGHFFQLSNGTGNGPMKDTATVFPGQTYTIDWVADNPGYWVFHCHNLYHMLNGLMHTLYVH
jgi:FtsP/CotA-like multicopper oxidase with cupredoxin domain